MLIDLSERTASQIYHIMVQTIIPRPIAWVLSDNGTGTYNVAPFSYFNGICSTPPLIMISVGRKTNGTRKDTWVNIEARSEFVVHISNRALIHDVVATSASLPHGESELSLVNLTTVKVEGFRLPRIAGPKVAMFCEKHAIHEVGDGPQGLILGRINAVWYDDKVAREDGRRLFIDAASIDAIARLGRSDYALFGETMTIAPPK